MINNKRRDEKLKETPGQEITSETDSHRYLMPRIHRALSAIFSHRHPVISYSLTVSSHSHGYIKFIMGTYIFLLRLEVFTLEEEQNSPC